MRPVFAIDPAAPVPPYDQLRCQVIERIAAGELLPGARLPTVRRLAAELGLAANTVARAYRELETEGYVVTAGRRGTVVAGETAASIEARRAADQFARRTRDLGLRPADALRLARNALDELGDRDDLDA